MYKRQELTKLLDDKISKFITFILGKWEFHMSGSLGVMSGKRGLIMGVANERSIAWGIAKMAANHGAELAFTYQGEALLKRLSPLAQSVNSEMVMQ